MATICVIAAVVVLASLLAIYKVSDINLLPRARHVSDIY